MIKKIMGAGFVLLLCTLHSICLAKPLPSADDMLASRVKMGKPVWLGKGKSRFLAIYQMASTAKVLGAYIILPDSHVNPDASQLISPLRKVLTQYGFSTLSLSLPVITEPSKKKARVAQVSVDTKDEASDSAKGKMPMVDTAFDPSEAVIAKRIDAAMTFLTKKDYTRIILLGHGTGALWAALYALKKPTAQELSGMVWLSLTIPANRLDPMALNQAIVNKELPTLDIIGSRQNQAALNALKQRIIQAKREENKQYWARVIEGADRHYAHAINPLVKKIRAWLRAYN